MIGFVDSAQVDFVINSGGGQFKPEGEIGQQMAAVRFDPGMLRPWIDGDGQRYVDILTGKMVVNERTKEEEAEREVVKLQTFINNGTVPAVFNADALPHETWKRIDRAVIKASRDRLVAWKDISAADTYGGFDAMGVTGLVRDTMVDPGSAMVSMSPVDEGQGDAPLFSPDILPLPFTHSGFHFDARQLAQSRNSGTPFDTAMAEACARRVAEAVENMTIGIVDYSGLKIGSSSVFTNRGIYGFLTHPDRITKTDITASASFDPETFVTEIITMCQLARDQKFYGPWVLYHSSNWAEYLDRDYYVTTSSGAAAPSKTVRQRVEMIEGITRVQQLDLMTSDDVLVLVQMTGETVRAINGMDIRTIQWPAKGGLQTNYKVMVCHVPDIRSQYVGRSTSSRKCGIVHGTTS